MHAELYNLREDPNEKQDLAADEPERAEQLRRELHQWREAVDAQMPQAKMARVVGLLTVDGVPADGAVVTFVPAKAGGHPATGKTDQDGRFKLTTFEPGDGAAPGVYTPTFAWTKVDDQGQVKSLLPKRYADARTSGFVVEVSAGENDFLFDLTSR